MQSRDILTETADGQIGKCGLIVFSMQHALLLAGMLLASEGQELLYDAEICSASPDTAGDGSTATLTDCAMLDSSEGSETQHTEVSLKASKHVTHNVFFEYVPQ